MEWDIGIWQHLLGDQAKASVKEIRKALEADGLTSAEVEGAVGRLFASKSVQVIEMDSLTVIYKARRRR